MFGGNFWAGSIGKKIPDHDSVHTCYCMLRYNKLYTTLQKVKTLGFLQAMIPESPEALFQDHATRGMFLNCCGIWHSGCVLGCAYMRLPRR